LWVAERDITAGLLVPAVSLWSEDESLRRVLQPCTSCYCTNSVAAFDYVNDRYGPRSAAN